MTTVLITGAAGTIGTALLKELGETDHRVIATDVSQPATLPANATFRKMDVRGRDVEDVIASEAPDVVVHLASIVSPTTRAFSFDVDVTGSRNVIEACIKNAVKRLVVTSSGAAYGYHADNPEWLTETAPLRGNPEFPYADHKRQVEALLVGAKQVAPALEQVVLRVGTVLGEGLENQITALFHKPRLLALIGSESPFVFIWTRDLAKILHRAIQDGPQGTFNVAGDGALGITELAALLNKPVLRLPPTLLKAALAIARPLKLSRYGPEQVRFLQYRPVLDNTALKTVFGYVPEKTSQETFELWRDGARL